jgi:hypothetical protein
VLGDFVEDSRQRADPQGLVARDRHVVLAVQGVLRRKWLPVCRVI